MRVRIPPGPRKEIFAYVYERADEYHYLEKTRPENATFMENLIRDPLVGGRLANYMEAPGVRVYIKDTILNKYAKDRKTLPRGVEEFLNPIYGEVVELDYRSQDNVSLHRVESDDRLLIVARTSELKWETGLRKLLQYVAAMPDTATTPSLFPVNPNPPGFVLIIFEYGSPMNEADKRLIQKGLNFINVCCLWA